MHGPWRFLAMLALVSAGCVEARAPGRPVGAPHTPRGPSAWPGPSASAMTRPRVPPAAAIVFRAQGFPTIDAPAIQAPVLTAALDGIPSLDAHTAPELGQLLAQHPDDVLVLPYGSAFPVDAWPAIKAFLRGGGGLAVLGGAPLHEPVRWENGEWMRSPRTTAFAHELLIGPAEPIAKGPGWKTVDAGLGAALPEGDTTWALTLRLTTEKEFPDEHGTAGPRDAVARPLGWVLDAGGTPRGCALLELDRLRGGSAGARWVFATTDARLDASAIHGIVARALMGGGPETRVLPLRASVAPGERPRIDVRTSGKFTLTVLDPSGKSAFAVTRPGAGVVDVEASLNPGLHRVVVERTDGPAPRIARGAFWVRDDKLLHTGPKLGVSRDWLTRDGHAFPVVGTTYMASDAHRHFLFEPNPDVWDRDMAEMKRRGIGLVRTGIWTAWSRVMKEPEGGAGARVVDEGVLAAIEAFVATAASHGIVVCFDLFAFLPPAYGGTNPYLDPRSLDGQKALAGALARRFAGVPWLHWDLINEPSYAPRAKLWSTKPIGDAHEQAAWASWVATRHRSPSVATLRALWGDASDDPMAIPTDEDFTRDPVQNGRHPRKARDFRELTEEIVAGWAAQMRATIRAAAGDTLVTLGQDEGGIYERATQQLLANALDYTSVHTWWKNDDLLWDGVTTKVIGKPSLHQETGLMRLERSDGTPWRTPEDAARLLERKLGYAFAARGAGVVEWVWNVNPYMPIDEETTIGLYRPDGTAKPELDALERYARFFAAATPYLGDFEPDPVVLVVPHARAFLGLPGAIDATKPVVRALAERFGVVPAAISDLRLEPARLQGVKLVLVPAPEVLDEPAANALLEASRTGTKVLFTGAITGDSYGRQARSLTQLGLLTAVRPVAMHERSPWSPTGSVTFEGHQETLLRAELPPLTKLTGNVWHEPLALEHARDPEPLVRLLRAALDAAKVSAAYASAPTEAGVAGRVLLAPQHALVTLVNERADAATRRVVVGTHSVEIHVPPRGTSLAVVERASGKIVASTERTP